MSGPPKRPVPPLFVERTFAGEGSEAERARVHADAREQLDALPADQARFLMRHDPDVVLRRIEARAKEAAVREALAPRSGRAWLPALVAVPALALLAVAVAPRLLAPPEETEVSRTKGLEAAVRLYRHRSGRTDRVNNGQVLFEGDTVQVSTVSGDAAHGVVVSIDGRGHVTRHFPPAGQDDTRLPRGEVFLPASFRLDDAPEFERFVMVWDDEPLDPAAVEASARGLGVEDPIPGFDHQKSVVIRKGDR